MPEDVIKNQVIQAVKEALQLVEAGRYQDFVAAYAALKSRFRCIIDIAPAGNGLSAVVDHLEILNVILSTLHQVIDEKKRMNIFNAHVNVLTALDRWEKASPALLAAQESGATWSPIPGCSCICCFP